MLHPAPRQGVGMALTPRFCFSPSRGPSCCPNPQHPRSWGPPSIPGPGVSRGAEPSGVPTAEGVLRAAGGEGVAIG